MKQVSQTSHTPPIRDCADEHTDIDSDVRSEPAIVSPTMVVKMRLPA
jgi:hypothetical protein